jgi:hypothetical protein
MISSDQSVGDRTVATITRGRAPDPPPRLARNPLHDASTILDDPSALRAHADRHGYLFLPGLMPASLVARLREVLRGHCAAQGVAIARGSGDNPPSIEVREQVGPGWQGRDDARWLALQRATLSDPLFRQLGDQPALFRVLEALFGTTPARANRDICRLAMPGCAHLTTRPHQDHYYIAGSRRLWTAWMPLVDCPLELGPLALLPGSGRQGLLVHVEGDQGAEVAPDAEWVTAPLAPGDVVLFHCLTVHRALENRSHDKLRASVDFRYQPAAG